MDGANEPEDPDGGRNGGGGARRAVALAVLLAALLGAGLWLSGTLRQTATVQDCLMAGRGNCAPLGQ